MDPQDSASAKKSNLGNKVTKVATYYHPRTWKEKGLWWTLGLFLTTYVIVVIVLGFIWSRSPGEFDVHQNALEKAHNEPKKLVPGYVTTATAIRIAETLLDKPGGYLSNDVTPPGVYLDNIPNWEFGALTELRDLTRAMRNDFSRSQTQSVEDKDLQLPIRSSITIRTPGFCRPPNRNIVRASKRCITIWNGSPTTKPTTASSSPAPTT
jgi:hypothetical protein